ncbi:hypothetical protein AB5J49_17625 [Streptomyces sp. R28]|uniref:Uncharacterized protein n=1 Tax=Streptomyces sp. R28 TaxID=3238628 RepID=A0AB39PWW7_9ACTN
MEAAGHVAVDLYDGTFLCDFEGDELHLIDLDEYRPGPFTLDVDRLPGRRRGAGLAGTAAQPAVLDRATGTDPGERFGSVRELVRAWRAATSQG